MYIPHFNAMDDPDEVRRFVESVGSAEIVTVGADGTPVATLLPILWSADGATVIAHMARANPHWREIADGSPCLAIVAGAQAYISPAWYAAKAEHGRVVPTWNYSAVHLTGTVRVHDDPDWTREAVTALTDRHEQPREEPWAVTDAPSTYIDKNLKAIVGLELTVARVEAKAKLSQNRSAADQAGVVAGLRAEGGSPAVADAMDL
ncbi:FMN-binding negative transcriptional regulator [Aeromicrobium sp. 9AM]|uniref:FMN-binding negative transcriptional regulator n=1 Tax=Aeromicrobium sp. 9AM TaxID=2653126 RepID=UPI0012EF7481|nr:FMN-binding negative transcriptional regulator [Aeromicrobium sp. 9AM]VXC21932.1 Transcriptional regulator [Aeromicrobium sp. 9AM]